MGNKDADANFNFAIGVDATILKTKVAGYIKGGNGKTEILVLPTDVDTIQTLSFSEITQAVAHQFNIDEDEMKSKITGIKDIFSEFDPDKLTFQLNQIYFYYKKEEPATTGGEASVTTEYAFSIKINLGGLLNLADIVSIDSLYLAIWNINEESVLKRFNMADLSALRPQKG